MGRNVRTISEWALSGDYDSLETASAEGLVRALGVIADGAPESDSETLYALDAILCELDRRPGVDLKTRRWLGTIHVGVLSQLEGIDDSLFGQFDEDSRR